MVVRVSHVPRKLVCSMGLILELLGHCLMERRSLHSLIYKGTSVVASRSSGEFRYFTQVPWMMMDTSRSAAAPPLRKATNRQSAKLQDSNDELSSANAGPLDKHFTPIMLCEEHLAVGSRNQGCRPVNFARDSVSGRQ